ncbi:hypothetical protein [Yinghuangia soli]|uniref:Uncharacterized protein n=1 Tax=Yinghuangia soli TaxID=2908204 RepID=A0AA41TYX3_9ACTN|nr:hypothetical protein [Yinghuangia soli]MCF2528238.1 hypothetical protein [Yinghuangia soli]
MVATWVRPGRTYAYGDVAPFEREALAAELGNLWNHQISGAGAPGAQVVQAWDVLLLRTCAALGLGPWAAQALWYAAICALAALGATALVRVWFRHPAAGAAAGLFAVANVYTLTMLPNPLPLLATGELAVLAALLLRLLRGDRISPLTFAFATLPAAYLAMNPPLLITIAAALAFLAVTLRGPALRTALLAAPLLLLLHAWWLVPQYLSAHGGGGAEFSADTDVRSWSWTHVRASVPNVLSLNAFWAWDLSGQGFPYVDYTPYGAALDTRPWSLLRWALPALAALGALHPPGTRTTRRTMRAIAVVALLLAFLCKGVHPPLVAANLWLYDHVPGMWLLREPMAKLGVVLTLCYATLAAAAIQRAATSKAPARIALATAATAALAYPHPLWTGEVSAAQRPGSAPDSTARVAIPDAWRTIAAEANSAAPGKVLQLPLQNFYMATTTWGFAGADTIPRQLITRPVYQRMPGGYFDAPPALRDALANVEKSLLTHQGQAAAAQLRDLGITQVILRHDLIPTPQTPRWLTASPESLAAGLATVPELHRRLATPVATLYALPPTPESPTLTPDRPLMVTPPPGTAITLTLPEAYAPGWHLQGVPTSWTATHTRSPNGWSNTWVLQAPTLGTATLTPTYTPQTKADAALWTSALTALAMTAAGILAHRPKLTRTRPRVART